MELELRINGTIASLDVAANESLMTMLRREGYGSVKQGCETGECGACTVLVDGVARPSCMMLAAQAGGCTITTVENLTIAGKLSPLQEAFIETGAVQCGFCTPGMLLSAHALLKRNPNPTENEVRDALSGNLCRCSGYMKPVQAVLRAAAIQRGEEAPKIEQSIISLEEQAGIMNGTGKQRAASGVERAGAVSTATAKIPALHLPGSGSAMQAGGRMEPQLRVIGKPVQNVEAMKHVTGRATFTSDIRQQGMLYGRILTSPHAHAVIREIDTSEAKALPGVHAVLTYNDIPRLAYSSVERLAGEVGLKDQYSLDYIVRYAGDRVAVVAAETPEVAEQALKLIEVKYDVQPALLDVRQALEPNAPRVHFESESQGIFDAAHNVAARIRSEVGDVERGFATADVIVEGEYIMAQGQAAPIENHSAVTYYDENGNLVVHSTTQAPHHIRRTLAQLLNLPLRRIRIVSNSVGGGFGVKQEMILEDLCALLTMATRRPVTLAYSREDELRSSRIRQQAIIRIKTGVKRDGTLVANQMVVLTSTGAYGTHPLIGQQSLGALALYPCANLRQAIEIVYTNHAPGAAARGYGAPEEFFALESQMNEIAARLGMNANELRRKNWIKAGDEYPLGRTSKQGMLPVVTSCGLSRCLEIVEEKLNKRSEQSTASNESKRVRHGIGIALSMHGNPAQPVGTGGAIIKLNEDGSFDIFAGSNAGESGAATLLAQVAAEVLGVAIEQITVHTHELDIVPMETGASSSSVLYVSGGAVKKAAEQARRQVLTVAGRMLSAMPEALKVSAGVATAPNGQSVTVAQIANYAFQMEGRHIMTTASSKGQPMPIAFGVQGVEVEVDNETGSVRVLKAVAAVDAGRIINPQLMQGQIQGTMARGLGVGLVEELIYDQQGTLLTTNPGDYHLHNAAEMPEMQSYLVETSDPADLFGAKAASEVPLAGMAPAIANAVADAIGIRVRQMPLTPERVLRAIHTSMAKK